MSSPLLLDPHKAAHALRLLAVRDNHRKYYRVGRAARFYGGIATADCLGCPLDCAFCWSQQRTRVRQVGRFYAPQDVFSALNRIARQKRFRKVRVSGNEPLLSPTHIIELIELCEQAGYRFILETSGVLLDRELAAELARFSQLHVRISVKGTNREEFSRLTGAIPEGFEMQLQALAYLHEAKVSCHAAVVVSFCTETEFSRFVDRVGQISRQIDIEDEVIMLYPHVEQELARRGLIPRHAIHPRSR